MTAFLQTRLGIQSILAGIIVNTGLYTINIAVMGFASNLNLFACDSVFTWAKDAIGGTWYKLIVAGSDCRTGRRIDLAVFKYETRTFHPGNRG